MICQFPHRCSRQTLNASEAEVWDVFCCFKARYIYYCNHSGVCHIDGLMQERRNPTANALGLRLSCINPPIWYYNERWACYNGTIVFRGHFRQHMHSTQIAKALGSTSIRHRPDTFSSDRWQIYIDPRVYATLEFSVGKSDIRPVSSLR